MSFEFVTKLPTPEEIRLQYPITEKIARVKAQRDQEIKDIFTGKSDRFLVIIGPCSADREDAVLEYCERLAKLQEAVSDKLVLIPRVYTNKPRTTGEGYKGMLHQPDPEGKEDMLAGIIASIVCFFKYVPSVRDALGKGAVAGVGPAVFTSAAVGVGTVAAASVGFTVIYEAIFNMPGGTYVSAATMAAALGGIMGSGSGAVGIIAQNFLEPYLATGVDPAALAKIIATSATIGGALPNSGAMFGMLAAMGLNHKNSYKHIAAISIGAGMCALVVMIIMANMGIY